MICFEMNTASVIYKTNNTVKYERGSYKFIFSLKTLTFNWKKDFTTYYIILYVVFLSILRKIYKSLSFWISLTKLRVN